MDKTMSGFFRILHIDLMSHSMKKTLFSLISFFCIYLALGQSANMNLLGTWNDPSIPTNNNNQTYNDCWGWSQGGREYAVIGSRVGSHIIDVTNPASPVEVDRVLGNYTGSNVIHRDFKVHRGHLYMVGDQGTSTLQIADLSYLPDSVHVVYDNNALIVKSHNIFVDSANDRLYHCGGSKLTGDNDLSVFDISNPANPVLLVDCKDDIAWWSGNIGYVHDIYVEGNIAYTHDLDAMHIIDFSTPTAPVVLGTLSSYPDQGINHSGWLHADDTTYVMLDETHGKRLKFLDVSNPSSINVTDLKGPGTSATAIPHNSFIKGDYAYTSYYYDGVYVFDVSDRNNVTIAGYYDTYAGPDGSGFHGCWGVYPYLPSGNIIASDLETGLYVFSLNTSPLPIAGFSGTPTTLCEGSSVSFADASLNGTTYQWSFPGGSPSSSTSQNPTVTYNLSGSYDVTLIVTNSNGSDTLTKTAYISVSPGPCYTLPSGGTAPTQTTCQGTLYDDGGPGGNYSANQDTYVLIAPTGASSVTINFPSFDVEDGTGSSAPPCGYDYVEVYDGNSVSAPLIGRYCNANTPPSSITSTGGSIYIKFHTDPGLHLQGFQLDWTCTISNPVPDIQFTVVNDTVNESSGVTQVDISLSAIYPSVVTVDVNLSGSSTASLGTDFTDPVSFPATLIFPPNTTSPQSVYINVLTDALTETDETVILTLSNPSNGAIGTNSQYTMVIQDGEAASINEETKDLYKMYPNPVSIGQSVYFSEKIDFKLYNVTGSLLLDEINTSELKTNGLSPGCYFVKSNNTIKKLIVK